LFKRGRVLKSYDAFVAQMTAIPLREPKGSFTGHVDIRKDNGAFSEETHFESGQVFASENEALQAGFQIAKQKIDTGFQPKDVVVNLDELVGSQD
jgi:hypothetical protein